MRFWQAEPQAVLTADTKVIVNVWLPKLNGQVCTAQEFIIAHSAGKVNQSNSRIGHVSMETRSMYASWWPNPQDDEQVEKFNVVHAQNSTYAEDVYNEGSAPDLRVCFYSLNVVEIEDCFNKIESNPDFGYVLSGDKKVARLLNDERGQSCCGLAYELLMAGGISAHNSIHKDLKLKWVIVTPDNFANFIKNAKQSEWDTYLETQAFPVIDSEYVPEPIVRSNLCPIL